MIGTNGKKKLGLFDAGPFFFLYIRTNNIVFTFLTKMVTM